ncbi:MAG: hypothetical protein K1060chlam3_00221 [Candidatus Anoxychlamydiales bacterium]|nr:hypothetical protein [Candidatus Anoxychlamydiales bacterium]
MNIVAFIAGILMIFAITTNTLSKKHLSDGFVSRSFSGYMKSSRKATNEYERYCFDNLKESVKSKQRTTADREKPSEDKKEKTREIHIENAKINIFQLVIDKKEKQKDTYNLIASLIKTLYSNQSFYKKGFEKDILNNILVAFENQIKKKQNLNFETLILKDGSLKNIYYKIIKGTKFYDFEKKIGCPSILDFVKVENSKEQIPMKDASKEFLITFFDKKITKEISALQIEYPPKNLTLQNVLSICQKNNLPIDENDLKLFDFSNSMYRSNEKTFVGFDKNTDIKCKIKLPVS